MFISKNSGTKQSQLVFHDSEWEIINLNIIIKKIQTPSRPFCVKDFIEGDCCGWTSSGCGQHGLLFIAVHSFLVAVALPVGGHWLEVPSFSSFTSRAQQLWHMGLVAPRHVESSRTRDQTCVPCIGRQIPNHWTTWEVHFSNSLLQFLHFILIQIE